MNVQQFELPDHPEHYTEPTSEELFRRSQSKLDHLMPDMERVAAIKAERMLKTKITRGPHAKLHSKNLHPLARSVTLRFAPQDIGQEIIDLICKRYTDHIPLAAILGQINTRFTKENRQPFALIDLYAVLASQLSLQNIKQRRKPPNELNVDKFMVFYETWQRGATFEQCKGSVFPFRNAYFLEKCFRSLMERARLDRKLDQADSIKQEGILTLKTADQTILRYAERRILENVTCLVIPIKKLPPYLLVFLKEIPRIKELIEDSEKIQEELEIREGIRHISDATKPPALDLTPEATAVVHITEPAAEGMDNEDRYVPIIEKSEQVHSSDAFDDESLDDVLNPSTESQPEGTPDPFAEE